MALLDDWLAQNEWQWTPYVSNALSRDAAAGSGWLDYLMSGIRGGATPFAAEGMPTFGQFATAMKGGGGGVLKNIFQGIMGIPGAGLGGLQQSATKKSAAPVVPSPASPLPAHTTPPTEPGTATPVNVPLRDTAAQGVMQWAPLLRTIASQQGVPLDVALAIMQIESGGRPDAGSVAGAQGLMQVMPFHWPKGTSREMMREPVENITKGLSILARNFKRYGNWDSAAAAYLGAIDKQGRPTTATDAYGTSGIEYVRRFNAARQHYAGVE